MLCVRSSSMDHPTSFPCASLSQGRKFSRNAVKPSTMISCYLSNSTTDRSSNSSTINSSNSSAAKIEPQSKQTEDTDSTHGISDCSSACAARTLISRAISSRFPKRISKNSDPTTAHQCSSQIVHSFSHKHSKNPKHPPSKDLLISPRLRLPTQQH